ncbi:MAG: hypothetical protein ABL908_12455 [Hyphomicrobium sp.]
MVALKRLIDAPGAVAREAVEYTRYGVSDEMAAKPRMGDALAKAGDEYVAFAHRGVAVIGCVLTLEHADSHVKSPCRAPDPAPTSQMTGSSRDR